MNMFPTILIFLIGFASAEVPRFRVVKEWHYINFTWPNEESLMTATAKGTYIPENNLLAGINYHQDYYYVGLPRMREGVPVTLGRFKVSESTAPLIEPFPSWEMNNLGDCNALQNVHNLEIDSRGRAWIIDIGRTSTLEERANTACSPKLVIFDIKSNRTTTIYTFPDDVASKNFNYLYDIVVDDSGSGYAYITDNSDKDPGIIVYSLKENHSWKIRHSKSMRSDPSIADFRVSDVTVSTPINVAGIALGPKAQTSNPNITIIEDRDVYYCPVSSRHLYSIKSSVLRNESSANLGREYEGAYKDVGIKASETDGMIMTNQGILYYGLLSISGIGTWNSSQPFASSQKIISKDVVYIQWPNSFAFDDAGNVIVLTNRLQTFIHHKLNLNDPNFRILEAITREKSYIYDDNAPLLYSVQNDNATLHEPAPEPAPKPEPHPALEPTSHPALEPTPHPTLEPAPHPALEPVPQPKPEPVPQPKPEPMPKPTPEPAPKPAFGSIPAESASKIAPDQNNGPSFLNGTGKDDGVVVKEAPSSGSHLLASAVMMVVICARCLTENC